MTASQRHLSMVIALKTLNLIFRIPRKQDVHFPETKLSMMMMMMMIMMMTIMIIKMTMIITMMTIT